MIVIDAGLLCICINNINFCDSLYQILFLSISYENMEMSLTLLGK